MPAEKRLPEKAVKLDARLQAAAAYVRQGKPVLDIGTDHALLPCYLVQQGYSHVMASDIHEKPLMTARQTAAVYAIDSIAFFLANGLDALPVPSDADIVIAGMGGETIGEILSRFSLRTTEQRFILQPMTRHAELRRMLYQNGYMLLSERAAAAGGKVYTVMHAAFSGTAQEITELFAYTGLQRDGAYLQQEYQKVCKRMLGDRAYAAVAQEMEQLLCSLNTQQSP